MPDARVLDLKPRLEDARQRPAQARAATREQIPIVWVPLLACRGSDGFCVRRRIRRGDGLVGVAMNALAARWLVILMVVTFWVIVGWWWL